jgi:hypothetical protein
MTKISRENTRLLEEKKRRARDDGDMATFAAINTQLAMPTIVDSSYSTPIFDSSPVSCDVSVSVDCGSSL